LTPFDFCVQHSVVTRIFEVISDQGIGEGRGAKRVNLVVEGKYPQRKERCRNFSTKERKKEVDKGSPIGRSVRTEKKKSVATMG